MIKRKFDKGCPKNDLGQYGTNDPMGTILCTPGQKYTVIYNSDRKSWIVTGYHEGDKENRIIESNNGNVEEYEMSLWGRVLTFDKSRDVFDPEHGKVGKIIPK